MAYCTQCGNQIEEGQICSCSENGKSKFKFDKTAAKDILYSMKGKTSNFDKTKAQGFFESLKNRMGIGYPERNATDVYERDMKIVPECISSNENEIPVKQYSIAILRNLITFERAEGRIQVTNKRVVLRAAGRSIGGRTTLQQEFAIDELSGIEAHNNFRFGFLYLIFGLFIVYLMMVLSSNIFNPIDVFFAERRHESYMNAVERINERFQDANQAEYDKYLKDSEAIRQQFDNSDIRQEELKKLDEQYFSSQQERYDKLQDDLKKRQERNNSSFNFWGIVKFFIGSAGWVCFFILHKKWLLKLAILGVSVAVFRPFTSIEFSVFLGMDTYTFWPYPVIFAVLTLIIIIVGLALYSLKPNLVLLIKTKGGMDSSVPIKIQHSKGFWIWKQDGGTGFSEVFPTKESERAIREINAMINDIQKLGDFGLEKWKE